MSQEERLREKLVKIREILKEDIGFEVYPFKVSNINIFFVLLIFFCHRYHRNFELLAAL